MTQNPRITIKEATLERLRIYAKPFQTEDQVINTLIDLVESRTSQLMPVTSTKKPTGAKTSPVKIKKENNKPKKPTNQKRKYTKKTKRENGFNYDEDIQRT